MTDVDLASIQPGDVHEAPVLWSERHRGWLALTHESVVDGLRAGWLSSDRTGTFERMARSRPAAFGAVVELLRAWMVFRDPPDHTRLRDPVRRAFTPRRVEGLHAEIEAIADGLLDALGAGVVDLVAAYARPLPAMVIARLLDIPESDREAFQAWSDDLAVVVFSAESREGDADRPTRAAARFRDYFAALAEERRRRPGDDLVSALVRDGGVDRTEVAGACTLLLFAGHETTASAIAGGATLLLDHPDQLERLREDAVRWPLAVEEIVRTGGPAKVMVRKATEARRWFGADVGAGDRVFLVLLAANHDPTVFDDPLRFDVSRQPNPHLGFGWGIHHCLGASLARLEIAVALQRLFDRFPAVQRVGVAPSFGGGTLGWAVPAVPVHLV